MKIKVNLVSITCNNDLVVAVANKQLPVITTTNSQKLNQVVIDWYHQQASLTITNKDIHWLLSNQQPNNDTLNVGALIMLNINQADRLKATTTLDIQWQSIFRGENAIKSYQRALIKEAHQVIKGRFLSKGLLGIKALLPEKFTTDIPAQAISAIMQKEHLRNNLRREFQKQLVFLYKQVKPKGRPANVFQLKH